MSDETIVAVFDTAAHAEAAAADIRKAGVPDSAISLHAGNTMGSGTMGAGTTGTAVPERGEGFWASLFGGEPDHDVAVYDRSVSSGSTVLTVKTPEAHVARVMQLLESHNPVDLDERAAGYGMTQTTTRTPLATRAQPRAATATTTDDKLQLAEESLTVGKRVVNRGGTRIRRYVVETPVEEKVTLHDEKVVVDRRPVTDGRPATDSFSEKSIELAGSAEEAVVSKTARVVEEIGLRKEVSDRVETVRDTVRKEQAEVEQVPGMATTATPKAGTPKV